MPTGIPATALQLRSLVRADQMVELFLETVEVPEPGSGEVVVRVEAAPINPSDLGLLLAGADVSAAVAGGAMYAQYRCADAALCLELPEGTAAADGASSFVNPMTVLGMVETMRR